MTEALVRSLEDGSVCVGLDYRIGEIIPDEDGPTDPVFLVAVKECEGEWWGVAGFTVDPDAMLATMAIDPLIMRVATSTILYGASWEAIVANPWFVYDAQLRAVANTPQRYWRLELEALKGFRAMLNTHNPGEVCALLNLTEKWAFDPGGTRRGAAS